MPTTARHTALPDPAGDGAAPPEWIHLLPAGEFRGVDGRGPYRLSDAGRVIAASLGDGRERLVLDENHATDLALQTGQPAPARGWITALQSRADGIWGRVDWTGTGAGLVASKEYGGVSPVFDYAKDGTVLRIRRAALTNLPNLAALTLLHSQGNGTGMDLMVLRAALGLPADADEAAILAAAQAAAAAQTAAGADLARVAEAAGVAPAAGMPATADAVVTALQTQRANAGNTALMAQEITSLTAQVQQLRQAEATRVATGVVDAAIAAGKPVAAVLREHYIARHVQDAAGVQRELDAMPSINAGGLADYSTALHAQGGAGDGLTPDERAAARAMGMSTDRWSKEKKRLAGAAG